MPIDKLKLRACLLTKFGFEVVAGSKHDAVALIVGGRKVATTRFSRGHHEIGDTVLRLIAGEIGVQLSYLRGMYSCTNSRADYIDLLRHSDRL